MCYISVKCVIILRPAIIRYRIPPVSAYYVLEVETDSWHKPKKTTKVRKQTNT